MNRPIAKRILTLFLLGAFLLALLFGAGCQSPYPTQEARIYAALLDLREAIWLPNSLMRTDEVHTLYSTLLATKPDLFYVGPYYTACSDAFDYVAYLKPEYRLTGDALTEAKSDYESRLVPLLSPAKEMDGSREKLLYLHDYLTAYFTYDDAQNIYDAYSLLTEGRGVCQAFSLLFFDLCERLGIQSEIVICPAMRHQWNRVCLDGVWLAVDLVWDLAEGGDQHFLIPEDVLLSLRTAKDPTWQYANYFYYG